jgi:hypothetical protein
MTLSNELDQALSNSGGELTPELEQMLELSETLKSDKIDQYDYVIKRLEAEAQFLKDRAAEFAQAAKARLNAVEAIRERIKYLMITHQKLELQGQYVRMQVSQSVPSLVIEDESQIPPEFIKIITIQKVDNAAVKEALQNGVPVEGAKLKVSYQLRTYAGNKKLK